MMDKMKDMKTKKRTLKKEEKKESETEYVIRAENVDYTYEGSKIKALDHLSLNIRKGKKVAVMGGNGWNWMQDTLTGCRCRWQRQGSFY